jgi:hypothetical protein
MQIDIHDPVLQARLQKQIQVTGASSVEEVLNRLLQTQEEQDRWLLDNREAVQTKIQRGVDQLDRGEGTPDDQARARLEQRKSAWLKEHPDAKP